MKNREYGGAAFEYLLVSAFAMLLTVALLGIVTAVTRDHVQKMAEKTGIVIEDHEFNPFKGLFE